jgi:hypothetical protein
MTNLVADNVVRFKSSEGLDNAGFTPRELLTYVACQTNS